MLAKGLLAKSPLGNIDDPIAKAGGFGRKLVRDPDDTAMNEKTHGTRGRKNRTKEIETR